MGHLRISLVEDDEPHIGAAALGRVLRKGESLRDFHAVHVSSADCGKGVAGTGDAGGKG